MYQCLLRLLSFEDFENDSRRYSKLSMPEACAIDQHVDGVKLAQMSELEIKRLLGVITMQGIFF